MASTSTLVTTYTDDYDGKPLDEKDVVRVRFSYNGKPLVLELSAKNADAFQAAIEPWADKAQPERTSTPQAATASKKGADPEAAERAAARKWAVENGLMELDKDGKLPRGRLAAGILEQYREAHPSK